MTLLTIFTIPRSFTDSHAALMQNNALASWKHLGGDVEVLVMGDDDGVAEAAREHRAIHIGGALTNEFGTPLLDWAFATAAACASGELLCYSNADIVLLDDFLDAVKRLPDRPYLAIGQRWDADVGEPLDFAQGGAKLRAWARAHGKYDPGRGSDYFVFRRETDFGLPPFAVGRPSWDNWMMGRARQLHLPLIDMTPSVLVIHQNHDYAHVATGRDGGVEGPEAEANRRLGVAQTGLARAGYYHHVANATHLLTPNGLRRALSRRHIRARIEEFVYMRPIAAPVRKLWLEKRLGAGT